MEAAKFKPAYESFFLQSLKIAFVVTLYWFTSISMVFLNKQLLNSEDFKLNAPFFVTLFQCIVAICFCQMLSFFSKCKGCTKFQSLRFDYKVSREVLPVSVCFLSMITFNNLSLRDLGVPFYNVGRSLTTLFNVILSYFILKKTTPPAALACCGVIILGYFIGLDVEGDLVELSYRGVLYGCLASFFVSVNTIYTARLLPSLDDNLWKLGYYNNLNSCVLLIPVVLLSGDMNTVWRYSGWSNPYLWAVLCIVGLCGFMTGIVSNWQIQVTTPLTHNVSGTAKACAQTVIAVIYYHTPKTALWWLSNLMILFGSLFYTIARSNAMKVNHDEKIRFERESRRSGVNNI